MQAVILAAGKGKRLKPLTNKLPKGLLEIAGKKIIEHDLSALPLEIDEVIIVIGYLGNNIKEYFKNKYAGKKIKYVWQKELLGTAHALYLCKRYLKNRFLVLMSDNIYSKADIKKCLRFRRSILTIIAKGEFNSIVRGEKQNLKCIKHINGNGFMNTGLYVLTNEIFKYKPVLLPDKEFGLPQTIAVMARHYPLKVVIAKKFYQINNNLDLMNAGKFLNHKS